jgi:formamidopyrimidine-DNA glycosylase
MPELPDVTVYVECLRHRVVGRELHRVRVASPFLLRTFEPPVESLDGRRVHAVTRMGKRIVLEFTDDLFAVIHLMIAGRFRWIDPPTTAPTATAPARTPAGRSKIELARFEFDRGVLVLTEASQKKRASLHVMPSRDQLAALAPAGLDVLTCTPDQFRDRLLAENRTLKRALTTPRLFDGIGNAYSDEILHAARLSPTQLTRNLDPTGIDRLHRAAAGTLARWITTLRSEFELDRGPGRFPGPGEITAFRPDFAVHGKHAEPCPVCGTKVQRIVYAENECNYCPRCQTNGRVLADRSLSRLLKDDWPATIEEWE